MPYSIDVDKLHTMQRLLAGTWSNKGAMKQEGEGKECPYSYNVMPLPQIEPEPAYYSGKNHPGYILKNFRYTESVTFHSGKDSSTASDVVAGPGAAPNRGQEHRQVPKAMFYDQVVYFAEGPEVGEVVHVENGAWLYLLYHEVINGPFHSEGKAVDRPDGAPEYAKQISVPHGNSILALGNYTGPHDGAPVIPQGSGLPTEVDVTRYRTQLDLISDPPSDNRRENDYENPHLPEVADPLLPLREAIEAHNPIRYHYVAFSTRLASNGLTGVVTNIPFEARMAAATDYEAHYWLLSATESGDEQKFDYLAYFQNITLRLRIGQTDYLFPHVTANFLKRQTKQY